MGGWVRACVGMRACARVRTCKGDTVGTKWVGTRLVVGERGADLHSVCACNMYVVDGCEWGLCAG